jgi:hypothetical protein
MVLIFETFVHDEFVMLACGFSHFFRLLHLLQCMVVNKN